jgi:hypothetical protein
LGAPTPPAPPPPPLSNDPEPPPRARGAPAPPCRIPPSSLVVPPTPPPDIDVETWEASLDTVGAWSPERLALTHFGAIEDDVPGHLEAVRAKLREEADLARRMSKEEYDADNESRIRRRLAEEGIGEDTVEELLQAVPTAYQWSGLDRYWRKKADRAAAGS